MPSLPLPIETPRLVLRAFTAADAADYHAYQSLEEVARYLYREPRTLEESRAFVARTAELPFEHEGDTLTLAVQARETPGVLGNVVLKWASEAARQAEIGYVFSPSARGHGYASEAAGAMLRIGFETYGFHRIFARLDVDNPASAAVARRLGMRQEAHLVENDYFKGRWGSELVFAILQSEWRSAQVQARS